MGSFKKEQQIFDIGKIKIGGQPGELPTVLIGTIFYEGHSVVENAVKGIFNKNRAEELLNKQSEISDKTTNPYMIDIFALTPKAMQKYIEFVADITDAPILVDSGFANVKISGIKYINEIGLKNAVVYNSLNWHFTDDEIKNLKENKIDAIIILAYNPQNIWPQGRIDILKDNFSKKGLLRLVNEAGIEKPLIDVVVLDVPSIGLAIEAVSLIKNEFGLPCGAGPVNAISEWKSIKKLGLYAKTVCIANAVTTMQFAGANFVFYGPIEKSEIIFPAAAMTDAIITYNSKFHGIKPITDKTPLYTIF